MATNRPNTRRRSVKQAFEDDDAPVAKRAKTAGELGGPGKRTNGATKRTTKAAYDENDDDFQFSRRTSRRTAAKAQPLVESIPKEPAKPAVSRRRKNSVPLVEPAATEPQKRRRSARLSGDKEQLEASADLGKQLPKRSKKSAPPEKERRVTPAPEPGERSALLGVQTPVQPWVVNEHKEKIKLPFADTPVILRNKDMRKGSKGGRRRSSTGLRGRRASSLIDSGLSNALPHSEVEIREFYKYIEQSLPEPRRMKQLLTWCGSRALPEKPSGDVKDVNAIMAARAIQQELIDDFANKPELSDWFSREDSTPLAVVKKPNLQNLKNQATLQDLEEEIKRLEEEKAAWEALTVTSNLMPPPTPPSISTPNPSFEDIDIALLDPTQASILAALQLQPSQLQPQPSDSSSSLDLPPPSAHPPTRPQFSFTTVSALQSHLLTLSAALEPNVDLFADGVHKIQNYRTTAERVADRVLSTAALRLEERDKEGKEKVGSERIGAADLLRGLAGVLND
ncbi:uncharacterized protein BDR25DRAFT_306272 [Lindgomyces ingoldianus]|uniref:Uncharacterized protein n=1 Tax=Lindgomyces ingoldianus TaxID=673940 RepID=A0ACB6QGN9_9PLEO|nr:uncharacterized protein BDR25DRAFT_306272 [Lindgomyces ingoldianus]KAF2466050.1 hypothetical protein BDR25DRAFT_306272 [Lindgomyces ingoldianus]